MYIKKVTRLTKVMKLLPKKISNFFIVNSSIKPTKPCVYFNIQSYFNFYFPSKIAKPSVKVQFLFCIESDFVLEF